MNLLLFMMATNHARSIAYRRLDFVMPYSPHCREMVMKSQDGEASARRRELLPSSRSVWRAITRAR